MSDDTSALTLTADDLAALRMATGIVCQTTREGHAIRAILDRSRYTPEPVAIYSAREQRLFPDTRNHARDRERTMVCGARMTAYGDGDVRYGSDHYTAFHYEQFPRMSEWASIAATMRVGDTVTLQWVASNNSEVTRSAGFVRDELRVSFGSANRARTFLIDVQVGPRNSARMVKPGGVA